MSVKVIIKKHQREVSGRLIKVNEECRLPEGMARTLENKGLCVIVAVGVPVAMTDRKQPFVEVKTKVAKKATKDATTAKKRRADAKPKAKPVPKKRAPKKATKKKKAASSVVTISDMAARTPAKK